MSKSDLNLLTDNADEPVDDTALARLARTDVGNSERFIARHGREVRFTQRIGTFVWDKKRWAHDDGQVLVRVKARGTSVAMIERELPALRESLGSEPDDADDDGSDDGAGDDKAAAEAKRATAKRKRVRASACAAFAKFALQSQNSARITNMIAEAEPLLQQRFEDWNNRGELFNTPSGTLVLDGVDIKQRPHRREDFITCIGGVAYDPDATCPLFREVLAKVQPEKDMRDFLQRYFGSAMVDSSKDQAILINHGGGANGKSTVIDAVCNAFGSYAVATDVSVLLHSDAKASGGGPQPSLIKLANGARLVRAAEPELGLRLSESLIKQLTGGEPMEARDMYEKPIEFRPRFKIVLSCNSRPPIRGGDFGIWRRILLAPWHVKISAEERDETLGERLKLEAAGILNWLIDGWMDWDEKGGLHPPQEVLLATEEYRQDSDAVGRFISEWCVADAAQRIEINELHLAFEAWCAAEQMKVLGLHLFGRRLTDRGIETQKSDGTSYRRGLTLTPKAVEAAGALALTKKDREMDREWRRGKRGASDDPPS